MAEIKVTRVGQGQTKIKNVPIAVTPEGFWCCPSPVVFQKSLKAQNPMNKPKAPCSPPTKTSVQKKPAPVPVPVSERRASAAAPTLSKLLLSDDQQCSSGPERTPARTTMAADRGPRPKIETLPRKVAIEFGEPGTCDMKVVLLGKQGFCVKLSVHKDVLAEKSSFFADKLSEQAGLSCLQIDDCEDVEIYVETVGLMYCKDMKQRLMKQSVSRILRILKVAEFLGFSSCIQPCLDYLEAVPWVGDEEEEKVVSTVLRLQAGVKVNPVLKRVSSDISNVPKDTLFQIIKLVLNSNEERGRREMKSIVLKLLRENNNSLPSQAVSSVICNDMIYGSCRSCLDSLLSLFKQATEPAFSDKPSDYRDPIIKHIALEADNLSWLLDILIDKLAADEFALMWANQQELATLHVKLPIVLRYHVSCISGRLFVGIGRGQLLPSKDMRQLLLQTWLQPLMNDYNWLQHGCRSFDGKLVEEGIGRTILTLPLEDQQSILLSWLGSFLKTGDSCPNLQRAFEVWWRRTFIRPHVESQGNAMSDRSMLLSKQHE
ncbi:hypothetical protein Lal_00028187 [Lupinus albus]|uniref:Putative chromatin remodeling & transcription regulator BTB-POZ family n=1 Tax=Lupinus albus TaxID=3870 RepID=A0A6A4QKZ7_LUPAL|nr:putative chromatin remodeling & transcription regulator BTB-POZ family [Lupinus albus]KAF1872279.1 hypothetical protein Lal_00028187 [Lupinus albus]